MNKIELNGSKFSLSRVLDGAGDSGSLLHAVDPTTGNVTGTNEIAVGQVVICGSPFARTFGFQDYWVTTPVTEIIEVNTDNTEVKFKTTNSIYTLKVL